MVMTSLGVAGLASHALSLQLFANSASKSDYSSCSNTSREHAHVFHTDYNVTVFNSTVYVTAHPEMNTTAGYIEHLLIDLLRVNKYYSLHIKMHYIFTNINI